MRTVYLFLYVRVCQTAEDDDVQNSHRGGRVHRAQQLRVEMDEAQKLTHRLQQQLDHGKKKKKNRSRTCDESEMRTDAGEDGWFYVPPGHNVRFSSFYLLTHTHAQ